MGISAPCEIGGEDTVVGSEIGALRIQPPLLDNAKLVLALMLKCDVGEIRRTRFQLG